MKKLLFLLFVTSLAHASIPVRDENGCTIGTRGAEEGAGPEIAADLKALGIKENRTARIPWYLTTGDSDSSVFQHPSPVHPEILCPPIKHSRIEILVPFTHKLVGHLEFAFSDTYITVPTEADVKYFPTKDVFVESTQSWNFKEFRK